MDFFVVCDKVLPLVEKIIVDEARQHVLINFNSIRTGGKSVESDHNTEILKLNMQYQGEKRRGLKYSILKILSVRKTFCF